MPRLRLGSTAVLPPWPDRGHPYFPPDDRLGVIPIAKFRRPKMPMLNLGDDPVHHAVADRRAARQCARYLAQEGVARADIERAGGVRDAIEFGVGQAHHWTALARPSGGSACAPPPKSPEKNQRAVQSLVANQKTQIYSPVNRSS